jgi:hypothetical protein
MITPINNVLKKLPFVISKLCFSDSNGLESSSTIKQTQKMDLTIKNNTKIISNIWKMNNMPS